MCKVITDKSFQNYGGTDLCAFDANPETDPAAPRSYRIRRTITMEEFVKQVASDMGQDPLRTRLWLMVNRQNKTIRPDQPIMDLRPMAEDIYARSSTNRDVSLRLWAEVADEVNEEGEAVWPSFSSQANGVLVRNDSIVLLLKHFDVDGQTLRGVGHVYIARDKKVEDLVPSILKKMGWGEKLPAEEKLLLWEVRMIQVIYTHTTDAVQEIKPTMIEPLKPKQSLKIAELQDGDIVCFQRAPDRKSEPENGAEKG